jgi:hypothetical protein
MKIAAPSEQDLKTVLTLNSLLSDLDECNRPFGSHSFIRDTDGEWNPEDPEHFDPENGDHCKVFVARILKLLNVSPGCTNRVIWGFDTAWSNNVFDPVSPHLAFHPDIIAAEAKATQTDTALRLLQWFIHQFQGDSGTGDTHWSQFPEYREALTLLTPPPAPAPAPAPANPEIPASC